MFDHAASTLVACYANADTPYMLEVPDTRMTLSHRVWPGQGCRAVMARHWFKGAVAVSPSRLIASSRGLVVLDLSRPRKSANVLSVALPTPGCLELHFDGAHCTDHLQGYWELRIYSGMAEQIARMFSAGSA